MSEGRVMVVTPEEVLSYFAREPGAPLRVRDLMTGIPVPPVRRRELRRILRNLAAEGSLIRLGRGKYVLAETSEVAVGTVEGYGSDLRLAGSGAAAGLPLVFEGAPPASHGDEVEVRVARGLEGPAVRVVRILRRAPRVVLAAYRQGRREGFAVPQDPRLPPRVLLEERASVPPGTLLLVEITNWPEEGGPPLGRVVRLLGEKDETFRFYLLLEEFGLPLGFPGNVLAEADDLPRSVSVDRADRRFDLRRLLTFTIDPSDAYDFDDAISLEPLPDSAYRVGVHIADVSHYVKAHSALDREACARGNSFYLEDGVVPMFPEELTRGILSLLSGVDRLTLSALVDVGPQGEPRSFRLLPSVIRSSRRLSYEEAEGLLGDGSAVRGSTGPAPLSLEEALRGMGHLAHLLRRRREARGALALELAEPRIIWGPERDPVDLTRRERLRSHRIVEEFMLLANEAVARSLGRAGHPLIYRVHEPPEPARLEELAGLLRPLGYILPAGEAAHALATVLRRARDSRLEELVSYLVLRSLQKAVYSERNLGHFGLATGDYTHFTSPIRRYPDLTVHRALRECWKGTSDDAAYGPQDWGREALAPAAHPVPAVGRGGIPRGRRLTRRRSRPAGAEASLLAEVARHASDREMLADQVERASFRQAAALFLRGRLGEDYEGLIVGFGRAGMYVRLDQLPVEGLVPFGWLGREHFTLWDEAGFLRGDRTGKTYRLGDEVRVRLARADVEAREIDFDILEHRPRARSGRSGKTSPGETRGGRGRRGPERARMRRAGRTHRGRRSPRARNARGGR